MVRLFKEIFDFFREVNGYKRQPYLYTIWTNKK